MNNDGMKLVEFDQWCETCKFYGKSEEDDPCCDCLEEPVNLYSHKPVKYKKATSANSTKSAKSRKKQGL